MRRVPVLLLALLVWAGAASAETFVGYYAEQIFLREKPAASTAIAYIEENTPLVMEKLNDKWASTVFKGKAGYVYLKNVIRLPDDKPCKQTVMFSAGRKYLYEYPLAHASIQVTLDKETPVTVQARNGNYLRVAVGGRQGYLADRDMQTLGQDTEVARYDVYAPAAVRLLSLPLYGAEKLNASLTAGQVYSVDAENNGCVRVEVNGVKGYVKAEDVRAFTVDDDALYLGYSDAPATLYSAPNGNAALSETLDAGVLYRFDAQYDGFYHVADTEWYVQGAAMHRFSIPRIQDAEIVSASELPLIALPQEGSSQLSLAMEGDVLYLTQYATARYYALQIGTQWGFADKSAVSRLENGESMQQTMAVTAAEARLTVTNGETKHITLPAGEKLTITRRADDYYLCQTSRGSGYIPAQSVRLLGANAPLTAYNVVIPKDIPLYDFPDGALRAQTAVIAAGSVVRVTAACRSYVYVQCGALKGYMQDDALRTNETRMLPTDENARYYLYLDKAGKTVTVYLADADGNRTDTVVKSALVTIGKRTTPTPTGVFTLGAKERWHTFSMSYTPHTTAYTKARYVHGVPCARKNAATAVDYMAVMGRAESGGCVRSPLEFAEWVYMNCASYITTLEIANGPLPATTTGGMLE